MRARGRLWVTPHCSFRKSNTCGLSYGHRGSTARVEDGFTRRRTVVIMPVEGKAHDLDNLYVVDGSFFVPGGAVNPALTIIANTLRVGDHLLERLR